MHVLVLDGKVIPSISSAEKGVILNYVHELQENFRILGHDPARIACQPITNSKLTLAKVHEFVQSRLAS